MRSGSEGLTSKTCSARPARSTGTASRRCSSFPPRVAWRPVGSSSGPTPGGRGVETPVPAADHSAERAQELLLVRFTQEQPNREELRRSHLRPALARLQDRHLSSIEVESIVDYGAPNSSAAVSVIVTLYGRIDFLHHQVLHFAQDPGMRDAELIYVLDSPELSEPLHHLAAQIHALHGFPFRVAKLSRNAGFPVANIIGTGLAGGRLLLLLNSDVLPDRPGWLEQMIEFYDSQPDIGALGPKLLFEDDSIQHAGVYFEREADSGLWGNLHYFKGLHREFEAARVNRPVPSLTGACLMVDRTLYEDVGGLRHEYILQGGYEDSDLCLRLIERGRRNWYLADAELYHLEGQAHAPVSRQTTVEHNTWLQTELWGPLIERVMSEEPSGQGLGMALSPGLYCARRGAFPEHRRHPEVSLPLSPWTSTAMCCRMTRCISMPRSCISGPAPTRWRRSALHWSQQRRDSVATILDFACGGGRVMRYLRAEFPEAEITGTDLYVAGLEFCAEAFGAKPIPGQLDLDDLELEGPFDLIWVGSLFTHLGNDDWDRMLAMFQETLSPGGVLVFTVYRPKHRPPDETGKHSRPETRARRGNHPRV